MTQLKGFKVVTTLVSLFKKIESVDKNMKIIVMKYENYCSSLKGEVNIHENDIDDVFQSIYTTVITNMQKSFGKRSGEIIDSVVDDTISISKYNLLDGSS